MKYLLILAAALVILALVLIPIPGFRFSIILCIGFALLSAGIWFLLRYPTPITSLVFKAICVLLVIGFSLAAVTLGFILRASHPHSPQACDHIIVLGAGVRGTVPSLSLQERINAAYAYLTAYPDTIAVLSGGQGSGEEITEAACMYRELTKMGIDGARLLLEENSTSTMENLQFSMDILEAQLGFRPEKVGIVSSEYHLFRAGLFARELELEATGIPAKTTWFALRANYSLREIAAVWKYLVLGP